MGTSMYRSTDGGRTLEAVKGAPGGDDNRSSWIDPQNPTRMIIGADQGPTITVDGGETGRRGTWCPTASSTSSRPTISFRTGFTRRSRTAAPSRSRAAATTARSARTTGIRSAATSKGTSSPTRSIGGSSTRTATGTSCDSIARPGRSVPSTLRMTRIDLVRVRAWRSRRRIRIVCSSAAVRAADRRSGRDVDAASATTSLVDRARSSRWRRRRSIRSCCGSGARPASSM